MFQQSVGWLNGTSAISRLLHSTFVQFSEFNLFSSRLNFPPLDRLPGWHSSDWAELTSGKKSSGRPVQLVIIVL